MTGKARTQYDSEQEAQLSAVKEVVRQRPAPHAAASFRIGVLILAVWLLLLGGAVVVLAVTRRDLRLAYALGLRGADRSLPNNSSRKSSATHDGLLLSAAGTPKWVAGRQGLPRAVDTKGLSHWWAAAEPGS
jgi:hypothetical protein